MVHVEETTSHRRYAGFFIRQADGLRLRSITDGPPEMASTRNDSSRRSALHLYPCNNGYGHRRQFSKWRMVQHLQAGRRQQLGSPSAKCVSLDKCSAYASA